MDKIIKVGISVMIKNGNKVLLGHRSNDRKDTGGINEPDSWGFPGGKQKYEETILEGAIREVYEETNLKISDIEIFSVSDDIQPDRHFITIQVIANSYSGKLKIMEPNKEDKWEWYDLDELPKNIYSSTKHFIDKYKDSFV